MQRVAVIDYGSSNLRSVAKALEHVAGGDHEILITDQAESILNADRVVFPGQGAIGDCMRQLHALNLTSLIHETLADRPFLGICMGLQSLMSTSDEDGGVECLDVFSGTVVRFPTDPPSALDGLPQKIPHMGWNEVGWAKPHTLTNNIPNKTRFYFVHSYHVKPKDESTVMARTDYIYPFVAALARDNIFATQFHPEKSADAGLQLLENFLNWDGCA